MSDYNQSSRLRDPVPINDQISNKSYRNAIPNGRESLNTRESVNPNQITRPMHLSMKSPDFMDVKYNNVVSFQYNTYNQDQFQIGSASNLQSGSKNQLLGRLSFNPGSSPMDKKSINLLDINEHSMNSIERNLRRESIYYENTDDDYPDIEYLNANPQQNTKIMKDNNSDQDVLGNLRLTKHPLGQSSILNSKINLNRESVLDKREKTIFIGCLEEIVRTESYLESTRQNLVNQDDFSVESLFNKIDFSGRGQIDFDSFIDFLQIIEVPSKNSRSLIDLFSFLDKNQQCYLTKYDIESLFIPSAQRNTSSFKKNNSSQTMGKKTIEILSEYFEQLFSLRKCMESVKKTLQNQNIDLNCIFLDIDQAYRGYVTREDLYDFINSAPEKSSFSNLQIDLFLQKCSGNPRANSVDFNSFYVYFSI